MGFEMEECVEVEQLSLFEADVYEGSMEEQVEMWEQQLAESIPE